MIALFGPGLACGYLRVVAAAIMMTVLVSLLSAIDISKAGRQIVFGATLLGLMALLAAVLISSAA